MSVSAQLETQARTRAARNTTPGPRAASVPNSRLRPKLSTTELAFRIYAAFRAHPHICNVLTHISRARWDEVERSINALLDPATTIDDLSPLGENILDLMVAERGTTGKILKPYFHTVLHGLLDPLRAERLIRHVEAVFLDLECRLEHPAPPAAPSEATQEADRV
jgi:hypothetical protein